MLPAGLTERDNRPLWDGRRGRYEVWFLTMSRPDGREGFWIRYTVRAPVAGPPEPRLWFARFDRDDPTKTFGVHGPPPGEPAGTSPGEPFVETPLHWGDAMLEPGRATGAIAGSGHQVRWDVRWPTGQPTLRLLPAPLYRDGLAPTRPYSPNPEVRMAGVIEVDGEETAVEGFAGQQGHVAGARHAERWAWASCSSFDDGYGFQALSAQARRGPVLTPFLTFGGVRIEGRWVRLRGSRRARAWSLGLWRLSLVSRTYRVEGEVRAPPERMIRARYLDPDDTPRFCHNSEVASSRLLLWERRAGGWQEVAALVSDGTTHAEWAGRTPAPAPMAEHVEVA
jgi:hypothetical protein